MLNTVFVLYYRGLAVSVNVNPNITKGIQKFPGTLNYRIFSERSCVKLYILRVREIKGVCTQQCNKLCVGVVVENLIGVVLFRVIMWQSRITINNTLHAV